MFKSENTYNKLKHKVKAANKYISIIKRRVNEKVCICIFDNNAGIQR
jgi:hypothetical protein